MTSLTDQINNAQFIKRDGDFLELVVDGNAVGFYDHDLQYHGISSGIASFLVKKIKCYIDPFYPLYTGKHPGKNNPYWLSFRLYHVRKSGCAAFIDDQTINQPFLLSDMFTYVDKILGEVGKDYYEKLEKIKIKKSPWWQQFFANKPDTKNG